MSFRVEKPVREGDGYRINIVDGMNVTQMTTTTEISFDDHTALNTFIAAFLEKVSTFFSKPIELKPFLERLKHVVFTNEFEVNEKSKVTWVPAYMKIYTNVYELHWTIVDVEVSPEETASPGSVKSPDRPYIPVNQRGALLRKKIRQQRIKCALARLRVEQLAEHYYTKYGTFDGLSDSDSELSSEDDMD